MHEEAAEGLGVFLHPMVERVKELRAERDRLQALPVVPDRMEYVETGETYGQIWKKLNPDERGPWLRKRGYKVRATRGRVVILDSTGAEVFEFISGHRQRVAVSEPNAEAAE
jgi:hypothetical protein